jgi:poly-beta-hydroxybutyrate-responsive repressor
MLTSHLKITLGEGKRDMAKEPEKNRYNHIGTDAWAKNWYVPVILLMLRQWNSYGYELLEKLSAFGLRATNPGTIYRTLQQMERNGVVHSNWNISEAGPAHRSYSITEAGEAYLKGWAESLDQYQQTMNAFFNLYTAQPEQRTQKSEKETGE